MLRDTPLEQTFQVNNKVAPVVIYDWMVHAHHVYDWVKIYQEYSWLPKNQFEQIVKAVWVWSINRGPEFLPQSDWKIIIVRDHKDGERNYWRKYAGDIDKELAEAWEVYGEHPSTEYKGTRNKRDSMFWDIEAIGKEYANKYFPCFDKELFEADDWAGQAGRQWDPLDSDNPRQMFLYTVDRDWSMITAEERGIYFANSRRPRPNERIQQRLVDNMAVIDHTEYKLNEIITHPKFLADAKSAKGDMGDNLPPGAPKYFFDLVTPPEEWMMENYDPALAALFESELNRFTDSNVQYDHLNEVYQKYSSVIERVRTC